VLDGEFGENARLKIGGEKVDPNSPAEGTGWSYDGAGKLTLTSATITGDAGYANIIAENMDLTIVLSGNNVVNSAKCGIRLDYGNLTITGGGSLTAESDNYYAITTVKGGLTIDGCTVSASCTGDNSYYAVESDGYLTIRNSTVTCSSTNSPICANGILTITGSSTVEATGKNAIESIDGGLSIGEGLAITEPFGGVNAGYNVKLNGKNVEHVLIEPGYTVSVSASEGGTASGGGGYKKDTDATATVTATAESGYLFVNWTENGEEVSTNPEYSFKVTGSRDLVANFEEVEPPTLYTVKLDPVTNGTATVSAEGVSPAAEISVEAGTEVTVAAEKNDGYELESITWTPEGGSASDITESGKFTVPEANVTVTVTFVKVEYTIVSGGDAEWTKGSTDEAEIVVKRSIRDDITYLLFKEVQVDGEVVDSSNYGFAAGSAVITLKPSYLETLKAGKHDVKVVFADGEAETSITIKEKPADNKKDDKKEDKKDNKDNKKEDSKKKAPGTGDEAEILPWALILGASMTGLGFTLTRRKRKQN
jgi:hypothetical protein